MTHWTVLGVVRVLSQTQCLPWVATAGFSSEKAHALVAAQTLSAHGPIGVAHLANCGSIDEIRRELDIANAALTAFSEAAADAGVRWWEVDP